MSVSAGLVRGVLAPVDRRTWRASLLDDGVALLLHAALAYDSTGHADPTVE